MSLTSFDMVIGLVTLIIIGVISMRLKIVDLGGLLASILIGYVILLGGGWYWLISMLIFFFVSAKFTRYKYDQKRNIDAAQEKEGRRGWPNAIANGGIASIFAILELVVGGGIFAAAFLGAVSSATADTLATEVGLLSKKKPRLIVDLRKIVTPGTSGGITILGTMAAFLASLLIGSTSLLFGIIEATPIKILIISVVGGISGSTIDSVIGATIQGMHKCKICNKLTESLRHCDRPTVKVKGIRIIERNVVNLVATIGGASVALFIYLFMP